MTAPTPAIVRSALVNVKRYRATWEEGVLADHIRAVSAEMRERAKRAESCREYCEACALENFADKLEGRES